MTMPELHAINKARPFVPYEIVMRDGRRVEVQSEGDALIPPRGWMAIIYQYHKPDDLVQYVIIEQIKSVEFSTAMTSSV
jgi:hypothetical protein